MKTHVFFILYLKCVGGIEMGHVVIFDKRILNVNWSSLAREFDLTSKKILTHVYTHFVIFQHRLLDCLHRPRHTSR